MNPKHPQTIYDSAEDRQLARILSTLIWATWSVYLVTTFTGLSYGDWKLIAVTLTGIVLLSASMLLLRRGHLRASSLIFVLDALGTVTMLATVGQGIRDLAIVAIPIIFVFAGLTLNRALFRLCVGLALAAVCWLVLGEIYDWFVPVPFAGEMANWLYLISTIVLLLVAALAVDLLAVNMRKGLELARQEITERKNAETRNRIIAETQDFLLHPCELKDIYRLVSEKVKQLIGDSITATAVLDEKNRTLRMGAYHGVDIPFEKVLSVIGFDPWQKEFSLDAMAEEGLNIYYNSKLGILEDGLYALIVHVVPKPACLLIEKLLRVQKIYGMGFVHKESHLGGLIILARSDITPQIAAIEQIVNLATIAIERKRAEEEVENSAKRFRALIEHGRDNISLVAADGILRWESPSVDSVLGYAPNQLVGENIFKLIHPGDQAWTSAMYAQVVQSPGSIQEGKLRLLHADGAWRWIECSAANLLEEPSVQAIVLNYRDITGRKHADEAFALSEAKYRRMVETTNEGVIVLDRETRMTLVNQQMAAMLGYTVAELLGRKLESLLFEEDLGDHRTQMQARAQGQSAVYERCFRRKDGGRLWTLVSATATTDAEGRFDGAFGMIADITERKRTEAMVSARLELLDFAASHALDEILQTTLDQVGALMDSPVGFYHFVESDQKTLSLQTWSTRTIQEFCQAEGQDRHYPIDQAGVWVECVYAKKPVIHNDYASLPASRRKGLPEGHAPVIRELVVPILRDGKVVAILGVGNKPADYTESDVAMVAYFADVAWEVVERKRAEDTLRENAIRYRTLLDNLPQLVWQRDLDSVFIDGNAACARMLGTTAEALAGKTDYDFYPVELAEKYRADDRRIIDTGASETFEERFLTGGRERVARTTKVPLRDNLGRIYGTLGIAEDITERKQGEEALRDSEERYRTLFQQASDGIFYLSADGKVLAVNESFARMHGYQVAEMPGMNLQDLDTPENTLLMPARMRRILAGEIIEFEVEHYHKDGHVFPLAVSTGLISVGGQNLIQAFHRDITERKRAEEKFTKAFQASPTIVTISRLSDGRLVDVNESFEKIIGYTRAEAFGHTIFELGLWVNLAEREQLVPILLANGRLRNEEVHFRTKRGEAITCLYSAELIELDGAKCALAVIEDITERKQAQEALHESESRFRGMFEQAGVGVAQIETATGKFVRINQAYCDIVGYSRAEMEKMDFQTITYPDDLNLDLANMELLKSGEISEFTMEKQYFTKSGGLTWVNLTVSPMWAKDETPNYHIAIVQNITTRKQAEDKIRAALEEKETLLREVHHRVKNNLQVIIALIKMRARLTQDAGTLQFLTELESQAHTMSLVYEQLYQSENLAQVNMAQYLRQLTANVLDTYGRRDAIHIQLDAPLALDVAQAMPCGLIVNELFSNILKYAFPPGFQEIPTVNITLRLEDETYHLTVSDNGVGFPPGYDWRAAQSMGLRLVNLWVTHQLGGALTVSGKPGTTFAIAFDLKD